MSNKCPFFFRPFWLDLKKTDIYLTGNRSGISKSKFKQFDMKKLSYIEKKCKRKAHENDFIYIVKSSIFLIKTELETYIMMKKTTVDYNWRNAQISQPTAK